jgi:Outer membrane protein beta-barrel domain
MKEIRLRTIIPAYLIIPLIGMLPDSLLAQENIEPNAFVLGGWAGYGQVNVDTDNSSGSSEGAFALGFRAGYTISSRIIMGIELNGWTLKSYNFNDPTKGESISNLSAFISYFPVNNLPIYVSGGAGGTSYTNNDPMLSSSEHGNSWFVGSGYEYPISKQLKLVPQIRYSKGSFTGGNYHVYEMSLGMNWYSK